MPGAKPIALDITDPASVAAAAQATGDVTVPINNAGSSTGSDLLRDGLPVRQITALDPVMGCQRIGYIPRAERPERRRIWSVKPWRREGLQWYTPLLRHRELRGMR